MADLTREQVKAIVVESLKVVADTGGDVEQATFSNFTDDHKRAFLSALRKKLNSSLYYLDDGGTSNQAYYDAPLKDNSIDGWPTVKDCIDWVEEKQITVFK